MIVKSLISTVAAGAILGASATAATAKHGSDDPVGHHRHSGHHSAMDDRGRDDGRHHHRHGGHDDGPNHH